MSYLNYLGSVRVPPAFRHSVLVLTITPWPLQLLSPLQSLLAVAQRPVPLQLLTP